MYILPYAVLEGHNPWLLTAISSTKQRLHFFSTCRRVEAWSVYLIAHFKWLSMVHMLVLQGRRHRPHVVFGSLLSAKGAFCGT